MALLVLFDFFFSSRRRHTRLQGDWSSDVCLPIYRCDAPGGRWQQADRTVPEGKHRGQTLPERVEAFARIRSEEHTSELQSPCNLVCRLLLEKKKQNAMKI